MSPYFTDYTAVLIATLVAVGMVLFSFVASYLIAPRKATAAKLSPYECGVPSEGSTPSLFHIRYYLFGILFLIFDVEAVFLFPWAVVFAKSNPAVFYEMLIFMAVLLFGLVYGWRKGILQWR